MKTVFTQGGSNPYNTNASALIEMRQQESGKQLFTVIYGAQVYSGLTYSQACKNLGEAILHHLCCESIASNEGS